MSGSSVAEFYGGRNVFITGATGFMGKVLVEKLLRSCPRINTIYLLMRPKGSESISSRLQEMLTSKLFDNLRGTNSKALVKLVAVEGDITLPGLGLSAADTKTLAQNVSVVFHAAATIKFDEALKLSLRMNVFGTIQMLELCHKMEKLVALVHVSTAYCNCDRYEVNEEIYPPPMVPKHLMQMVDCLDDDVVNSLTPTLIGKRPNTYTFTKALAEYVVLQESSHLPITIVRPSIVCAAWQEPLKGWVDNINGITGFLIGVGKGLVRTVHCDPSLTVDIIPVDVPINLLIVAGWYTATHRNEKLNIFNCVSGTERPITWGQLNEFGMKALEVNAMDNVVWYPSLHLTKHKLVNSIAVIFKHWIPAYVMDMMSRCTGSKPIMVRVAQKFSRAALSLEYFSTNEWRFSNENVQTLWKTLSEADQHSFNFCLSTLHWPTYIRDYCLGSKQYVMKEDLSVMPKVRSHLKRMWWLHQAFQTMMILFLLSLVMFPSFEYYGEWSRISNSTIECGRNFPK